MFWTMFEKIQNIMLTMHISDVFQTINQIPEKITLLRIGKHRIVKTLHTPTQILFNHIHTILIICDGITHEIFEESKTVPNIENKLVTIFKDPSSI